MRAKVFLSSVFACSLVHATGANIDECLKISDNSSRLECFDAVLKYKVPDVPAAEQPAQKPWASFIIRQKGDVSNFAGVDVLDKPALLSLQRSDGNDASIAKIAVIGFISSINNLGWQPFVSGSWNRDVSIKTPIDIRDVSIGVTGPLWDVIPSGWTLQPTLRATYRTDLYDTSDEKLLALHVNVVKLSWVNSVPGAKDNSYTLVPNFGFIAEKRTGGGPTEGIWRGGYIGFEAAAELNRIFPRLSATAGYLRFADDSSPVGNLKRRDGFMTLGLSYALTDPEEKAIAMRPFLTLSREVGTDILGGGGPTNKTWLSLSVKYN